MDRHTIDIGNHLIPEAAPRPVALAPRGEEGSSAENRPAARERPSAGAQERGKRRHIVSREPVPPVAVAAALPPVVPSVAPTPAPPARGAHEVLAEAEKLLGQGDVADACARGEEAKRLAPRQASVHKFLGKCYMRAGKTREASDSYKQYLELAPTAVDAPFIRGMLK